MARTNTSAHTFRYRCQTISYPRKLGSLGVNEWKLLLVSAVSDLPHFPATTPHFILDPSTSSAPHSEHSEHCDLPWSVI